VAAYLNEHGGQDVDAVQTRHLKLDKRQPMPKNMDALQCDL